MNEFIEWCGKAERTVEAPIEAAKEIVRGVRERDPEAIAAGVAVIVVATVFAVVAVPLTAKLTAITGNPNTVLAGHIDAVAVSVYAALAIVRAVFRRMGGPRRR